MNYPINEIERLEKSLVFSTEGYVQVKRKDLLVVLKAVKSCEHKFSYLVTEDTIAHG